MTCVKNLAGGQKSHPTQGEKTVHELVLTEQTRVDST